jgi:hypothetical protein
MNVNSATMASMLDANRRRYVEDFRPVLRQEFPEFWVRFSDARIDQMLLDQCSYAQALGLDTARGAYLVFTLRARLGSDFPHGPAHGWARAILQRKGFQESELLDELEACVWGAA